jgi:hypothetical protein
LDADDTTDFSGVNAASLFRVDPEGGGSIHFRNVVTITHILTV